MDSAQDSYKKWGIILIVFLLIFIPLGITLARSNPTKLKLLFQEKPKVTKIDKQISEIRQEQHPSLYFVDLEYDPQTGKSSKKNSGYVNGDLPPLRSEVSFSPETFNFRVEAISPKNELILSGWGSLYKSVISTDDGKYSFRVSIPYVSGETLRVYSIGYQKLWEEKVK